jgi:hypothetical protein
VYSVAIFGQTLSSQLAALACQASGFNEINRFPAFAPAQDQHSVYSLGANASRLIKALAPDCLEDIGFIPDRYQVRFAKSAYLLAELPLGDFYQHRYGSPMLNVAAAKLHQRLESAIKQPLLDAVTLAEAEQNHAVSIVSAPQHHGSDDSGSSPQYRIFRATLPDHPLRRANVLWRGRGQYIEQHGDQEHVHFRFVTRADTDFVMTDWHESLHEALSNRAELGWISASHIQPNQTLFAGRVAYLGDHTAGALACKIDASNTGLEDAWVLSRMMENYEDDIADGLAAYERFRRPRHRKVAANTQRYLLRLTEPATSKRLGQHIGTALQNRLLPEIALQQQDWLYQHDVIKGFR